MQLVLHLGWLLDQSSHGCLSEISACGGLDAPVVEVTADRCEGLAFVVVPSVVNVLDDGLLMPAWIHALLVLVPEPTEHGMA